MSFEAQHLYKTHNKKNIVSDVNISLNKSEVVGLLGPNGAGKSTSFYILAGIIKPSSGAIYLNQKDITQLSLSFRAKLGISYLPQESSIFRNMSVEENIMTALEVVEKDWETRQHLVEELMTEFSIEHLRKADAVSLSGGERRRLEIARCMAIRPEYILLDEPLAGIDPIAISNISSLIQDLKSKGVGVLITDHNAKEIFSLVDRAYIMYEGKIIAYGTSKELSSNKQVREKYLGSNFNQYSE